MPEIEAHPLVFPHCVYAAARQSFDAEVRRSTTPREALHLIFEALPLAEHGWDIATTRISAASYAGYWPVWHLERS